MVIYIGNPRPNKNETSSTPSKAGKGRKWPEKSESPEKQEKPEKSAKPGYDNTILPEMERKG